MRCLARKAQYPLLCGTTKPVQWNGHRLQVTYDDACLCNALHAVHSMIDRDLELKSRDRGPRQARENCCTTARDLVQQSDRL